jgi:hypothetical protein
MRNWLALFLISSFVFPLAALSVLASPVMTNDIALTLSATSRQIIVNYLAPDTSPCTIEVSESNTYSPVVNDVNNTLFTASSSDARAGSLGAGTTSRVVVIGTVPRDGVPYDNLAADGFRYSRSLAVDTTHYVRVTCGVHTGTGSIDTKTISPGKTRGEIPPVGGPGVWAWPTIRRRAGIPQGIVVDPTTGVKMNFFIPARGTMSEAVTSKSSFADTALGTNWSNLNNVLVDDSSSATYTAGTQDKAFVRAGWGAISQYDLYTPKLWVKGNASGSGDNAVLDVCLSTDGSTCFSDTQEIAMSAVANTEHCHPNNGTPTTCAAEPSEATLAWKNGITSGRPLINADISANASTWGWLFWKKGTGAGTITIQSLKYDLFVNYMHAWYDNGAQQAWSHATVNDGSGTPGYLLVTRQLGLSNLLWWVNTASLEVRFLGDLFIPADATFSRTFVNSFTSGFSDSDPTVYYGTATDVDGKTILVKAQLPTSGNSFYNASKVMDTHATTTWSVLTADLETAMHTFDSSYDASKFGCSFSHVQRGTVFARCFYGQQDSMGWVVAVNGSTGAIIGMLASWKSTGTRWCGYHTEEPASQDATYFNYTVSDMHATGGNAGGGPWTLNTANSLSATSELASDTITVASLSPASTNDPATLYDLQAGDVLSLDWTGDNGRTEEVLINSITGSGPYTLTVTRGYGARTSKSHPSGEVMRPMCTGVNLAVDYTQGGALFWKWDTDTHGASPIIDFGSLAGSHAGLARKASGTGAWRVSASQHVKDVTDESTAPQVGTEYVISHSPLFGGVDDASHGKDRGAGNALQSHPEPPHNFADVSSLARTTAFDILPHVGDTGLNPSSCTNVTGQLFKCVPSLPLNRKFIPTYVSFTTMPGVDISSTATGNVIDGTTTFSNKYCVAEAVNECYSGSSVGDVYVNSPLLASDSNCSAGGETANTAPFHASGQCLGPMQSFVNSLIQYRLDRADAGVGLGYNFGRNTRVLSSGLWTPQRRMSNTATSKISPDGKVMLVPIRADQNGDDFDAALVKVPTFPEDDSIDRSNFVTKTLTIHLLGGATEVFARFGYDPNFNCTSRTAKCVAAQSNNPYFFESTDSFTAVPCTGGCTVGVPLISDRVVYGQLVYRDNGHNVVMTSGVFVMTEDIGPLFASSNNYTTSVSGKSTLRGKISIQ